jgi:tetratricopeptide (TPR) repeat protein
MKFRHIFFLLFLLVAFGLPLLYPEQLNRFYVTAYHQWVKKESKQSSLDRAQSLYDSKKFAELKDFVKDMTVLYPGERRFLVYGGLAEIGTGNLIEGARAVVASLGPKDDPGKYGSVIEILFLEKEYGDIVDLLNGRRVNDSYLRFIYGTSLSQIGRYTRAVEELEGALGAGRDDFETRFGLGCAYEGAGRTDDAIRQYEAAYGMEPANPEVKTALIRVYKKAHLYAKAEKIVRRAVR